MRVVKLLAYVLGVLFVLAFLVGNGMAFLVTVPVVLAFGWVVYVTEVLPEVQLNPAALAEAGVVLAVLAGGVHAFARWLAHERGGAWSVARTGGLLAGVMLMFVVSIASAGVAHQVAWLASEDLLESSWAVRPRSLELCLDLAQQPDPAAALGSEPARFEVDTYAIRIMDVLDDVQVLMWPRDAVQRLDEGAVICDGLGGAGTLEPEVLAHCLTLPASSPCPS